MMRLFYLLVLSVIATGCGQGPIVRVVDMERLFEEFTYTKELKREFEARTKSEQFSLDSLYRDVASYRDFVIKQPTEDGQRLLYNMQKQFQERSTRFDKYKTELTEVSDKKVLKQLNEYISDFCHKTKISVLLGDSDNDISTVYVDNKYDITDKLITHVNQSYEGQ